LKPSQSKPTFDIVLLTAFHVTMNPHFQGHQRLLIGPAMQYRKAVVQGCLGFFLPREKVWIHTVSRYDVIAP